MADGPVRPAESIDVAVSAIQANADSTTALSPEQRHKRLEQVAKAAVGSVFFAPMLKMARDNPWKGKYGHGGRGEEVFGAQLDMELAERASGRLDNGLVGAMVRQYERKA